MPAAQVGQFHRSAERLKRNGRTERNGCTEMIGRSSVAISAQGRRQDVVYARQIHA